MKPFTKFREAKDVTPERLNRLVDEVKRVSGEVTNITRINTYSGSSSGVSTATLHSSLSGLLYDDHTQYHNDARADTWFLTKNHHDLLGLGDDDHTQYLLANGTRALTADWDVGAAGNILCDRINARNSDGLLLMDDGGNYGIHVRDGGNVSIGKLAGTGYKFRINNSGASNNTYLGMYGYHSSATGCEIHMVRSRANTIDGMSKSLDGDVYGNIKFYGVNSADLSFVNGAEIYVTQKGAAGASYNACNMNLETYSTSGVNSNQLVLKNDGKVGIGAIPSDSKFEVNGDIRVPFSQSLRIGGITGTGNDGMRIAAVADYGYIDLKGSGGILVRVDDVDGGTEVLGIGGSLISAKVAFESLANTTLGNESTDLITCVGRLIHRTLSADPTSTATAGNLGEIAFYNDTFYGKKTGTGTDTNWFALANSVHAHTDYVNKDGTIAMTADWNMGNYKVGIRRVPTDDELEVHGDASIVDDTNSHLAVECYSSVESDFPSVRFKKSDSNTIRTMQQTNTLAVLGKLLFYGCNSSNAEANGVIIEAKQNGVAGATYVPADLTIETYSSSAKNTSQLVIHSNGNVGVKMVPDASYALDVTGDVRVSNDVRVTGDVYADEVECETLDVNGGGFIGDDSTDVFRVNGRWCLREVGLEPGVDSVPGSPGEIVLYGNRMYAKVDSGENDWYGFEAIGHNHDSDYADISHTHTEYINKDGTVAFTGDWNAGSYNIGLGVTPSAKLDIADTSLEIYERTHGNNATGIVHKFIKSRHATIGSYTETQDNDVISEHQFYGVTSLGSQANCAKIVVQQNGSSGSSYVPANMTLMGGGSSGVNSNQLVLGANGKVGINQEPSGSYNLDVNGSGKFSTTLTTDGKLTVNNNVDLGVDEDDTVNIYGSLLIRNLGAVPTSSATYGRRGEIGRYNDHLYLKITDTGTNTNWSLIV